SDRVKRPLRNLAKSAWQGRIPSGLVLAALAGWLGSVWFQAPEKQLESLAEKMRSIGSYGWTEAQANALLNAELALSDKLQHDSPVWGLSSSTSNASCATFCT